MSVVWKHSHTYYAHAPTCALQMPWQMNILAGCFFFFFFFICERDTMHKHSEKTAH